MVKGGAPLCSKNINFIIESLSFESRLLNGPHSISGVIRPCLYSFYWSAVPFWLGFTNYISLPSGVSLNLLQYFLTDKYITHLQKHWYQKSTYRSTNLAFMYPLELF